MNFKQKISALSAAALPLVALSAFLLIHPTKAHATGECPDGQTYAGEYDGFDGTCANGEGGFYYVGGAGGFAVCPDGNGSYGGGGYCVSDGCVQCIYPND